jgi:YbbR domain-containing protein
MKEKLTRNIGLKILSIILAAFLWLLITNVDDPITRVPFDNVKVKILNEDAITSQGKVYEILEGAVIDFTVAARRSIAEDLTASDFEITANFAKLSEVNAVTIDIKCPRYGDEVTVTDGLYQVMKINLEEKVDKNFKVTVATKGTPAEGYWVGEKSASTIITVTGPKSKIERISEIVAEVNVADASENFRSVEKLKAVDKEGKEIDASNLSFSEQYATINIGIYQTRQIDLNIVTTGTPASGYVVANVDYEPKTIEIAGKYSVLDKVHDITIEEDVSGAYDNIEKEVDLSEQLEEGLILVGEDQTVAVNIVIEKIATKEITVWPMDIEIRGLNLTTGATILTPGPIVLRAEGLAKELKNLSRSNLKPYINLQDYTTGTFTVPIKADLGADLSLNGSPTINVLIEDK